MSRTARLGVFIFATLAILAIGIFLIGSKQFLFSSSYHIKANFDSVAGLDNGAEVRVGGVHKGTVSVIQLPTQSNGKVAVVMKMESSTRDVVKADSVASIQTEGLMGSKYVDISFGSKDAPKIQDWETIGSQPPVDISDLIKKTNDMLDSGKTAMNNIDELSGNLKSVSAKVDEGKGTLGALVNDKKMYQQLSDTTAQAKEGATAFQENMQALKSNFFLRGFYKRRGYSDSSELTKYEIPNLPQSPQLKEFSYDAAKLFNKPDAAKLKNAKALDSVGHYLEQNKFGLAVVVTKTGMKGDTDKDKELSEARGMVVRDYLAKNFKFDDTLLRTLALGKIAGGAGSDAGGVEIVVYPAGVASAEPRPMRASQ